MPPGAVGYEELFGWCCGNCDTGASVKGNCAVERVAVAGGAEGTCSSQRQSVRLTDIQAKIPDRIR